MARSAQHTIEIDLSHVIASVTAAIRGAVEAATDGVVSAAKQAPVKAAPKPAKAPRAPKAAKDAPKHARAPKGDPGALADTIARSLGAGIPLGMGALVEATGASSGQVKRALDGMAGLVVTGAKRGTKYALAPSSVQVPPMGAHVNGVEA